MSNNWVQDINDMHAKFGVHKWVAQKVAESDTETLRKYMQFRIDFLKEELLETAKAAGLQLALNKDNELVFIRSGADADPEEIVDGLIDLCVVAIGTLDAFGVDAYKAWDAVHAANMAKEPGVKPSRPNPLKLPDLIKPTMETHGYNWEAPNHNNNHGLLKKIT